jgi:hypothetical protein
MQVEGPFHRRRRKSDAEQVDPLALPLAPEGRQRDTRSHGEGEGEGDDLRGGRKGRAVRARDG